MHPPGSFTKNFGWESEPGLKKLRTAIRAGFASNKTPIARDTWRGNSGLDQDRQLVALNFFLHNTVVDGSNTVTVDELVWQSVIEQHSDHFDLLALFALNLSVAGKRVGKNGIAAPSQWANSFIRNHLWDAGAWVADELNRNRFETSMGSLISATPDTIEKCTTNYRRLFELCGYPVDGTGTLNSHSEAIVQSACFLLWDRLTADSVLPRSPSAAQLQTTAERREVYKLLGTTKAFVDDALSVIASNYIAAGATTRLTTRSPVQSTKKVIAPPTVLPDWLTADQTDAVAERQLAQVSRLKRDRALAVWLKELYDHKCMFCGEVLLIGINPDRLYSEAAHIRPLGAPHNGSDKNSNMIVLCPNHHLQFDMGALRLRANGVDWEIVTADQKSPLLGKAISLKPGHALDAVSVQYHFAWHAPRRR
jgi:hypothetical protein